MKASKNIMIIILSIFLSYCAVTLIGLAYFETLSKRDKCVIISQLQMGQTPWQRAFYEDQKSLERFCAAINKN